jgi:hypothetical protein
MLIYDGRRMSIPQKCTKYQLVCFYTLKTYVYNMHHAAWFEFGLLLLCFALLNDELWYSYNLHQYNDDDVIKFSLIRLIKFVDENFYRFINRHEMWEWEWIETNFTDCLKDLQEKESVW